MDSHRCVDTIYDLASLSKLFTSTAAVQLIQQGRLPLDETVVRYLPAFDNNGKGDITILQLLTYVSGLPPDPSPPLWTYQTMAERVHAVMTTVPRPVGTQYIYSDLNMITLQFVAEAITGRTLDGLVRDWITDRSACATPGTTRPLAEATDRRRRRSTGAGPRPGLGQVHDENAWAMGGVAGHAGLFSTATTWPCSARPS